MLIFIKLRLFKCLFGRLPTNKSNFRIWIGAYFGDSRKNMKFCVRLELSGLAVGQTLLPTKGLIFGLVPTSSKIFSTTISHANQIILSCLIKIEANSVLYLSFQPGWRLKINLEDSRIILTRNQDFYDNDGHKKSDWSFGQQKFHLSFEFYLIAIKLSFHSFGKTLLWR